jgi:arginyl-tRNA--protein-N-Asp/Glu arginylyltransferase
MTLANYADAAAGVNLGNLRGDTLNYSECAVINEFFVASHVAPEEMDMLWAEGWRHFGSYFFRYSEAEHDGANYHVIPLRIELDSFVLSQSQTRVRRKNRDVQVVIRDAVIDHDKEALFDRHRQRFKDNVPDSLHDFLSEQPASVPCRNQEICVYQGDRLLAVSFLDIGQKSTSAVYAAFEPAQQKRSLGIFTMLCAIEHSQSLGMRYYYPGYAYREPSFYDYKKNFSGTEFLDWSTGWKPYVK